MKIPSLLRTLVPGLALVAGASLAAPAFAQEASAAAPVIHQRKHVQQQRIGQGVTSGSLTPRETSRLEKQEAALNHEERAMRTQNGGALTPADRAKLERQQNRLSRRIYRQKHDAQHQ